MEVEIEYNEKECRYEFRNLKGGFFIYDETIENHPDRAARIFFHGVNRIFGLKEEHGE